MSRHTNRKSSNPKGPKTKLGLPDLDHSKSAVLDRSTPGEITAKTLKSRLLHSFEVLDPIRFPRFSAIG
jgi:hypothetical protein